MKEKNSHISVFTKPGVETKIIEKTSLFVVVREALSI